MFKNRQEAGQLLGQKLLKELGEVKEKGVVLGIPRGGVVIAKEVAKRLGFSLDIMVTKKLGAPNQSELAIGAVGETKGAKYLDKELVKDLGIDQAYLNQETKRKKEEIKRREALFRQGRPALDLKNKIVIITDDGAATGATIIAACREVWHYQPKKLIIGLPVLARDTLKKLTKEADETIFLETPKMFFAVGQFYEQFKQTTDQEVINLLKE